MLFAGPFVMHSRIDDGRHWLTVPGVPPLQILPVARNHCRVGHFLAKLLAAKLARAKVVPGTLALSRRDLRLVPSFAGRYPELKGGAASVTMRLIRARSPQDDGEQEGPEFVTPQPPKLWRGGYDGWIVAVGRKLGVRVDPAAGPRGYEEAMRTAMAKVQRRLPAIRKRFLAGMGELNLGFKVGLRTRSGGREYVWVSPEDWSKADTLIGRLESQPHDCKGYKQGQKMRLATTKLADYAIGSEKTGLVDPGLTSRIAEDYGLVMS
jgi:hypothetical protein